MLNGNNFMINLSHSFERANPVVYTKRMVYTSRYLVLCERAHCATRILGTEHTQKMHAFHGACCVEFSVHMNTKLLTVHQTRGHSAHKQIWMHTYVYVYQHFSVLERDHRPCWAGRPTEPTPNRKYIGSGEPLRRSSCAQLAYVLLQTTHTHIRSYNHADVSV